jgi:hypothetical protein
VFTRGPYAGVVGLARSSSSGYGGTIVKGEPVNDGELSDGQRRGRRCKDFNEAMSRGHRRDAMSYVVEVLMALDRGEHVDIDFLGREDVGRFCWLVGIRRNWAELTVSQIAPAGTSGPNEVPQPEAGVLLSGLAELIDANAFRPKNGSSFDPTVLNDFLPVGSFHGKHCRGNAWEFAYALAVELEHGRTFGANITNNHPALTALIVMAHVLEDRLYYARLWVMEVEGELFKLTENGASPADLKPVQQELQRAKDYLSFRVSQP